MADKHDLATLKEQRQQAAAELDALDRAIAHLEEEGRSHMLDASCPHCDFVVAGEDDHLAYHLRDVHPNPAIYPDAQQQ